MSAYRLEFLLPLTEYFSIRGSSPVLAGTRLLSEKNRNSHWPIWFCRSLWPLSPLCSLFLTLIFLFLKTLCLCASVVNSCFLFGSGYAGLGSGHSTEFCKSLFSLPGTPLLLRVHIR